MKDKKNIKARKGIYLIINETSASINFSLNLNLNPTIVEGIIKTN